MLMGMGISDVIKTLRNGQVAKATFADDHWYIVNCHGALRYSDEYGHSVGGLATMSYSNLMADYELVEK